MEINVEKFIQANLQKTPPSLLQLSISKFILTSILHWYIRHYSTLLSLTTNPYIDKPDIIMLSLTWNFLVSNFLCAFLGFRLIKVRPYHKRGNNLMNELDYSPSSISPLALGCPSRFWSWERKQRWPTQDMAAVCRQLFRSPHETYRWFLRCYPTDIQYPQKPIWGCVTQRRWETRPSWKQAELHTRQEERQHLLQIHPHPSRPSRKHSPCCCTS